MTTTFLEPDVAVMDKEKKLFLDEKIEAVRDDVANGLRAQREYLGLSLAGLSERTGIDRQTLWKYERRKKIPSTDTLIRLSDALGVDFNITARNAAPTVQPDPSDDEFPTDYDAVTPT